jgi:hypothetical protein
MQPEQDGTRESIRPWAGREGNGGAPVRGGVGERRFAVVNPLWLDLAEELPFPNALRAIRGGYQVGIADSPVFDVKHSLSL